MKEKPEKAEEIDVVPGEAAHLVRADSLLRDDSQMKDEDLSLEYLFMSQGALQGGLHLHVLELFDGEVQVL